MVDANVRKRVFRWEITQFVSSSSMLAVKVKFDPNEPKMAKKFSVIFQLKNKRNENEQWDETNAMFRANEVAKITEFLSMKEPVEKSTYYYRLDDENDARSLIRLLGGGKLAESIVKDRRNFPVAIVLQHRYTDKDGNTKGKVIVLFKGSEKRKDKYRGSISSDFVKLVVRDGSNLYLKKLSDIEVENFKLQLEAVVKMTTILPVIYKLDYIISAISTPESGVETGEKAEEEAVVEE